MPGSPLDTVVEIATPEHLAFRSRVAGPGRRFLAWMIDGLVAMAALVVVALAAQVLGAAGLGGVDQGVFLIGLFAVWWGYFFVSELVSGGRSVGKAALKLRVVHSDGLPVTWRASLLRNLLRAADLSLVPPMVLVLGPLVMALDPRFRRLGDLAADTLVIVEERTEAEPETAGLEVSPEVEAALPSALLALDPHEMEALDLFVSRRAIGPARREELAQMVAPHFAERLAVPTPRDATSFLVALWRRATQALRDPAESP
ncbi:MAG: RDD family protein [Myxococcota bacterium]